MQDADLFLELAGIAGVFVGFGALIAVRSGGATGPDEIAPMRAMVSLGVLSVVGALAPVTLSRYGMNGHELWALSSGLVLAGWVVALVAMIRTPEYRAGWAAEIEANRGSRPTPAVIVGAGTYAIYMLASLLGPVVIALGLVPEHEAALYFSVVVLVVLGAAWTLLSLVFAQRAATG